MIDWLTFVIAFIMGIFVTVAFTIASEIRLLRLGFRAGLKKKYENPADIESIPIDWIDSWCVLTDNEDGVIDVMVADWRRENE